MQALEYRADIDGLRAVAVTSVVVFHAFQGSILPGGFTGVDIFFVISGYLITRIIADEISKGTFTLLNFYERRIKRIVPALLVVLVASLAAGWFVLQPGDYQSMAQSAIYAVFSFSNVFFLNHTGYFDAAANTMPLLHTWSLGVEEQFYIVWPALLGVAFWASRRFRRSILSLLLPLAGIALLYSVWLTGFDSKAAFYLSTARAYELLIGAIVAVGIVPQAWLHRTLVAHSASLLGAGLIGCGFLFLEPSRPFPGLKALLPTLGAALIISSGLAGSGIINRVLAIAPVAFLGRISYSLYLWHWPVLVFFAHYAARPPNAEEAIILTAISVLLSMLSYWLVEGPARELTRPVGLHYIGFAASAAAVSVPALIIVLTGGALTRVPPEGRGMASLETMWKWDCRDLRSIEGLSATPEIEFCTFGAPWETAKQHGFLWGDSHAEHYAPLLDLVGRDLDIAFVLYSGCQPMVDNRTVFDNRGANAICAAERDLALSWLADRPGTWVILASVWAGLPAVLNDDGKTERVLGSGLKLMTSGLQETIRAIDPARHSVVLLGQFPQVLGLNVLCAQRTLSRLAMRPCQTDTALDAIKERAYHEPSDAALKLIAQQASVGVINPVDKLCTGASCPTFINGEFIYRDDNHIRRNLGYETKREIAARIGLLEAFQCGSPPCALKSATLLGAPLERAVPRD